MKPFILTVLIALLTSHPPGEKRVISGDFDNFFIDPLGNYYTVKDNVVVRYNQKGLETHRYSSLLYGHIDWLDVSSPFKILVFFKDFETLLFLDNRLSKTSRVFSPEDNLPFIPLLACHSREEGIWILDQTTESIIRIDNHKQIQAKSNPVAGLPGDNPRFMTQQDDKILIHTDSMVIIFDTFANYQTTLHFPKNALITWSPKGITALNNDTLILYHFEKQEYRTIPWPYKSTIAIRHTKNNIYYLNPKGIFSVKINAL